MCDVYLTQKKKKSELFGGALCSPIFVESKLKINKK